MITLGFGILFMWIAFLNIRLLVMAGEQIKANAELGQLQKEWDLFNATRISSAQPTDPHPGM